MAVAAFSTRRPAETLTHDEMRALLRAPSLRAPTGVRNRALMATLYGAGLRCAEALSLRTIDVDLDAGSIRVLHGKNDWTRTVAILDSALIHIDRWMVQRKELGLPGRTLFCTLNGDPVSDRYVRAMTARMAKRAGIERRVHPHALRHTHAAELEANGITVTEIQQQLGHRWLNTTQTYLNHICPSQRIARIRAVGAEL